jgi:serine protease Do
VARRLLARLLSVGEGRRPNATSRLCPNAGDISQNVNFAIKASVVANFLQDNAIKFQIGEATQPMKGPDLADEAKALSAFIVCR